MGLLKLRTTGNKHNLNPNTNFNRNPNRIYHTNSSKH